MRGLLTAGGPMTGLLARVPVGKMDAKGQPPRMFGQAAATGGKPPERDRVSPWRVFDRVLGGQTISEGLDAERARLEAMAAQPGQDARMQALRSAAEAMGPAAMIAFETNPEAFGAQLSEQYAPQVIAAGGVQSIAGTGQRTAAPSFDEFGDSIVRRDPISGAVDTVATRGPTFGEQTSRISATAPVSVAPGGRLVDPQTGSQVASGAPRVFSAADGTDLYTEQGDLLAQNQRDAPQQDPQDARRARQSVESMARQVGSVESAIERASRNINGFTTGLGSVTSMIPGTPAANLAAELDTIEANLSFQALAEMRANSPTGGALGSITERELTLLGSTVASLRQSQSPEQLRRNLGIIRESLQRLRDAQQQAYQDQYGDGQSRRSSGPRVGEIQQGYRFRGGDPANPQSWERVQ